MTRLAIHGPAHAVAAVTQALSALPLTNLTAAWTLRVPPCVCEGACRCEFRRCEIREGGRVVLAGTWERAVGMMLAPAVPLKEIAVRRPGRVA